MDPYRALYLLKLFTKMEKPTVATMLRVVARIEPGETSFQRHFTGRGVFVNKGDDVKNKVDYQHPASTQESTEHCVHLDTQHLSRFPCMISQEQAGKAAIS